MRFQITYRSSSSNLTFEEETNGTSITTFSFDAMIETVAESSPRASPPLWTGKPPAVSTGPLNFWYVRGGMHTSSLQRLLWKIVWKDLDRILFLFCANYPLSVAFCVSPNQRWHSLSKVYKPARVKGFCWWKHVYLTRCRQNFYELFGLKYDTQCPRHMNVHLVKGYTGCVHTTIFNFFSARGYNIILDSGKWN